MAGRGMVLALAMVLAAPVAAEEAHDHRRRHPAARGDIRAPLRHRRAGGRGSSAPAPTARTGIAATRRRRGSPNSWRRGRCVASRSDVDRYGRLVSVCTAGGVDLGGRLVAEGLARAYARYSDAYLEVEADARAAGRGLWHGAAEAPWEYRAEGFTAAAGAGAHHRRAARSRATCRRGGERIYHLPGSPSYARTRIDPSRGEAWFCDEAAASAAGFRPVRGR